MKKKYFQFFLVLLLLGISNIYLGACSCDTVSFDKAIEYSDEIFLGNIIRVERYKNGKFLNGNNEEEFNWDWKYYFEVDKKWKGNRKRKLIIYQQGNSCDFWFNIYRKEYLVYATRDSGKERPLGVTTGVNDGKKKLTTWLCSRTIDNLDMEEENWFYQDLEKLDLKFSGGVELEYFQINYKWPIITGIMVLVIGLILRKIT